MDMRSSSDSSKEARGQNPRCDGTRLSPEMKLTSCRPVLGYKTMQAASTKCLESRADGRPGSLTWTFPAASHHMLFVYHGGKVNYTSTVNSYHLPKFCRIIPFDRVTVNRNTDDNTATNSCTTHMLVWRIIPFLRVHLILSSWIAHSWDWRRSDWFGRATDRAVWLQLRPWHL